MGDQPIFRPSCPAELPFYACDYGTRFLGCCADGAGDEVCATGCDNVRAATFDGNYYSSVTQNDCNDTGGHILWYTCEGTSPPFMGCCANNPCANGCRQEDLFAAQLSIDQKEKAAFSSILLEEPSGSQHQTGKIAGGVIGGLLFVGITISSLLLYRRRKLRIQIKDTAIGEGLKGILICQIFTVVRSHF